MLGEQATWHQPKQGHNSRQSEGDGQVMPLCKTDFYPKVDFFDWHLCSPASPGWQNPWGCPPWQRWWEGSQGYSWPHTMRGPSTVPLCHGRPRGQSRSSNHLCFSLLVSGLLFTLNRSSEGAWVRSGAGGAREAEGQVSAAQSVQAAERGQRLLLQVATGS